jgi:hypothetical protein
MTFEFSSDGPVSVNTGWTKVLAHPNGDHVTIHQESDAEFLRSCGIEPAEEK